jgi:hypothetical protein
LSCASATKVAARTKVIRAVAPSKKKDLSVHGVRINV